MGCKETERCLPSLLSIQIHFECLREQHFRVKYSKSFMDLISFDSLPTALMIAFPLVIQV